MFLRWRRMDGEGRRGVWRLYGWFSGLMLCGSCFGAVAWGARMQSLVLGFNVNNNPSSTLTNAQQASIFAQVERWVAAFVVVYAMEFLCLPPRSSHTRPRQNQNKRQQPSSPTPQLLLPL